MNAADERRLLSCARAVCKALEIDLKMGQTLLVLADAETEALLACDAGRVAELQARTREVMAMQAAHVPERMGAIRQLAAVLGLTGEGPSPTLSAMMQKLPGAEARHLASLRTQILDVQNRLKAAGERNRPLIENALDFVQYSLHIIMVAACKPNKYGPQHVETPALLVNCTC